jgi:hypothetical protein
MIWGKRRWNMKIKSQGFWLKIKKINKKKKLKGKAKKDKIRRVKTR